MVSTFSLAQVRKIVTKEEESMKTETEIVEDFARAATEDLQAVLPALHVSRT